MCVCVCVCACLFVCVCMQGLQRGKCKEGNSIARRKAEGVQEEEFNCARRVQGGKGTKGKGKEKSASFPRLREEQGVQEGKGK